MKIEQVPIESVKPYPKNNRLHSEVQIDMIARSISEFGFNQPLVIDEKNEILVGHGRLLAAKKLGLPMIPVHKVSGLTPVQKRAYRILDNKLQNDSNWDFEALKIEFDYLIDSELDLERWGLNILRDIILDQYDDVAKEWQDMPEFNQQDMTSLQRIIVHFKSREDVKEFARLINQSLTDRTKSTWFPYQAPKKMNDIKIVDET